MIIYKDALGYAHDEVLTDSYKIEEICDGVVLKVKGKMKTETTKVDDSMFGGNASAEGGDEGGAEDASQSGIDVVLAHRLVETTYKKKEFMTTIKAVMAKIKARVEEEFPADKDKFTKQSAKFVKEQVIDNFKDWGFYCGESMDPDGTPILCRWETDDSGDDKPCLYFFRHGLEAEKC